MLIRATLPALLLLLLVACGPDTQQAPTTALDDEQNIQISGVIVEQNAASGGVSAVEIAAAKARVPHQFKEKPPLSLFDFRTNLNPASNR